jgi:delta-aminolevulinic acid dehydratase/porphobilinogen synthase
MSNCVNEQIHANQDSYRILPAGTGAGGDLILTYWAELVADILKGEK